MNKKEDYPALTRMKVIRTRPGHEIIMANYFAVNEEHLKKWSPSVPKGHHTIESWQRRLTERELEHKGGLSAHFIGTDEEESHVIGSCSLSNIVRGVFQACHMGYSIAERYQGQGYMKKIVRHAISYAFNDMKLHRIMANHMPENERSAALLKSLEFEREGYAKDYLLINGKWEDHVLNALINTNFRR
ncbi:MAG: GNAT family N-acetyltransferase [Gammaproteobacteria bacterium]|nr:GNAT family N-acetyltransferase [Gammaproteobacteria bacterium]MDD9894863.1 GNAT family N-acetyltransferase [Gammaproteobacteria bacterium]MDD9957939.1 GNAT family N-acetyltransferase [Gammaproteobacteria bacterium]